MSFGFLVQVFVDLLLMAGIAFLWFKLMRPQKDDPRLSRGLQLLQSKIAVLEDLSDEVDSQVQQLTTLLEVKAKDMQSHLDAADKKIRKIEEAMSKSLEVAEIFQDRIPHQEIIERQNTIKYVQAARLAHQGHSIDEIASKVDLSRAELEMIVRVNRDQLQFSEEELPEWAKSESAENIRVEKAELNLRPLAKAEDKIKMPSFIEEASAKVAIPASIAPPILEMPNKPKPVVARETATTSSGKSVEVQKVIFPRINMTDHLS